MLWRSRGDEGPCTDRRRRPCHVVFILGPTHLQAEKQGRVSAQVREKAISHLLEEARTLADRYLLDLGEDVGMAVSGQY